VQVALELARETSAAIVTDVSIFSEVGSGSLKCRDDTGDPSKISVLKMQPIWRTTSRSALRLLS
jgi:hypothetical protein